MSLLLTHQISHIVLVCALLCLCEQMLAGLLKSILVNFRKDITTEIGEYSPIHCLIRFLRGDVVQYQLVSEVHTGYSRRKQWHLSFLYEWSDSVEHCEKPACGSIKVSVAKKVKKRFGVRLIVWWISFQPLWSRMVTFWSSIPSCYLQVMTMHENSALKIHWRLPTILKTSN